MENEIKKENNATETPDTTLEEANKIESEAETAVLEGEKGCDNPSESPDSSDCNPEQEAAEDQGSLEVSGGKIFCTNCGAELQPDQKFCPKCGANQEIKVENSVAVEEFNKQLAEAKKKKKKKLIIVFIAIIVAIGLAVGGKFAFTSIRHSIGISKVDKAVEAYKTDEIDYDSATATITKMKASKDTDVVSHAKKAEKTIGKLKKSKEHFKKGELYKNKKEYKNAITHYEAVIKEDPNYEKAQAAIKEVVSLWEKTLPTEIEALLKKDKSDDASALVKTFLGYSPDNTSIANIGKFIEAEQFYAKGYLNSAQDIYKSLPSDLEVNGITVKSRIDTLKKYSIFVKMCGKWTPTKYYMETKEKWKSGRSTWWYRDGKTDKNMYLEVTCIIGKNGKVTISGEVKYRMYTNYSSINSLVNDDYFTSSFKTTREIPSNGKISYSFKAGDFTLGGSYIPDSQKIEFNGSSFYHSISMTYHYSTRCDEIYSSNETFGTRVEKY